MINIQLNKLNNYRLNKYKLDKLIDNNFKKIIDKIESSIIFLSYFKFQHNYIINDINVDNGIIFDLIISIDDKKIYETSFIYILCQDILYFNDIDKLMFDNTCKNDDYLFLQIFNEKIFYQNFIMSLLINKI